MNIGLNIGHAKAEVAANNAGSEWKREAYEAFVMYAKNHKYFTTEEVRMSNTHINMNVDNRAWGQVALKANRNGIVSSAGWTRATSKTVHGMVVTKWMSNLVGETTKGQDES